MEKDVLNLRLITALTILQNYGCWDDLCRPSCYNTLWPSVRDQGLMGKAWSPSPSTVVQAILGGPMFELLFLLFVYLLPREEVYGLCLCGSFSLDLIVLWRFFRKGWVKSPFWSERLRFLEMRVVEEKPISVPTLQVENMRSGRHKRTHSGIIVNIWEGWK